ncbi:hypothetical protein [Sphingomonas sp. SORGH_AS_0950]|uniref:hypothetical protein n=1 Tax=Sphingomonas sp. SORGH_AS_0950 TaxID=3041792 RepID=UPI00358E19C7
MTHIRYARASNADGSHVHDLQRDALIAAGVDPDPIYDDSASGRLGSGPVSMARLTTTRSPSAMPASVIE